MIGLARSVRFEKIEESEPALAVALRVEVLRRVAAGGVDQDRFLGEPPVAVARAADAGDGLGGLRRGRAGTSARS